MMRPNSNLTSFFSAIATLSLLITPAFAAPPVAGPVADTNTIHVVCLGDSLTSGGGLAEPDAECYPAKLQALLGASWTVHNEGHPGASCLTRADYPLWQTGAIPSAMSKAPRVVLILLGTNDSRPQNWELADRFVPDYVDLANTFVNMWTHPKVWLCTPLPIHGDAPDAQAWDQRVRTDVIPKVRQVAAQLGLPVIDLYEPFRERADLFTDGVHPNAAGAELMAALIARAIQADGTPTP